MLLALLADIHSNRQAFSACLDDAAARGATGFALLGDYVGYGADPVWCVDTCMALAGAGAVAVQGNHDQAIGSPSPGMNEEAEFALDWTRRQLGVEERGFLSSLPLTITDGDILYVHSDASAPQRWIYVRTVEEAARSLRATTARITFCGHTHRPLVFSTTPLSKMTVFTPVSGVPIPLQGYRRWLVVLGSVGQPRDGIAAACYALFDTAASEITYVRVPYDIDAAAAAILDAKLPPFFATRLYSGR
jgi:diadenosine tetraphosphatase ApaH/serine/threonine PP2A family protein phosphatase